MPRPSSPTRRPLAALLAFVAVVLTTTIVPGTVTAAPLTVGGFTTAAIPGAADVARGGTVTLSVEVTAAATRQALVDVEVFDAGGRKVHQQWWDAQAFTAGQRRTFTSQWAVAAGEVLGVYTVKLGIFGSGWTSLLHWNDQAATVRVVAAAPPTTSTTTTTVRPTTTSTTTTSTTTTTVRPTTTTSTTTTTVRPTTTTAVPAGPGGFTTAASPSAPDVARGASVTLSVHVTAAATRQALVDVEVFDAGGRKVHQQWWDAQAFTAGQRRTFTSQWAVASGEMLGVYTVKLGIFGSGWTSLLHWNDQAATVRVVAGAPPPPVSTTTTTTTTTTPTTTIATTTTVAPTARFETLPVGATLPSEASCAARVRPAVEVRPANATFNQTRGATNPRLTGVIFGRVTGNFVGTTDEIIQWAACKWGIDEDIVRAQTAKESYWFQRNGGDFTTDPNLCAPGHGMGADGRPGECAESVGVQQVRWVYHKAGFPGSESSTAMNLDYALAARRNCFEGNEGWLNQFERGRDYAAGDMWGCVGLWFSGRWYTPSTTPYIADVQSYLAQRIWTTRSFIDYTG